jgi:diguanylate cyclase (GGDEF)-like protein
MLMASRGRWLGCMYAVGAMLSALSLVVPHGSGYDEAGIAAVSAIAAAVALPLLVTRYEPSEPIAHVIVVLGSVATTAVIHFSAGLPNAAALFYVWIVLFAFYVFPLQAAIGHLLLVIALYIVGTVWTESEYPLVANTLATIGTLAGSGALVAALRRRIEGLLTTLAETAHSDELTGLPNPRAFDFNLERELARSERAHELLGLAIVDVDHFKRINDSLGHQAGDEVLRRLSAVLRSAVRDGDLPARIGGEEFAVMLPGAARADAARLGERIRQNVRLAFDGDAPRVTVSVGVATTTPDDPLPANELMRRADEALYAAKAAGRDRVVAFDPLRAQTRRESAVV